MSDVATAAANAGLLYTAKGTAALLVPLTSVLSAARGWHDVFVAASLLNIAAAGMALFVLKPLRTRMTLGRLYARRAER